jgi:hypothetical protein
MVSPGSIFIAAKTSARRARDRDVRALLRKYLNALYDGTHTVLLEELGLCQGNVFIDVAAVNGEFSGFEIKSPSDTLTRWPKQQTYYSKVVDRAWIVAPEHTLEQSNAPDWWGQIAVFDSDDRLALRVVHPAAVNPKQDPLSLAKLLWRDEALEILRDAGAARGVMTKPRRVIWRRLIESVSLDDLRAAVCTALTCRAERVAHLR